MKSIAVISVPVLAASVSFALFALSTRADNVCDCENPPGGMVRCEEGQVAICRIKEGKVLAECKTPPSYARHGAALKGWLASEILKTKVKPEETESGELKNAFKKGQFELQTGEIVKFGYSDKKG